MKKKSARQRRLEALKRETERELRMQIRDLLALPMAERTHFLLVPVVWPDGRIGWSL